MKDHKLEDRQTNYRKCNFELFRRVEDQHLSLRKKELNQEINSSRQKSFKIRDEALEIDIEFLKLDPRDRKFKIKNIVRYFKLERRFAKSHPIFEW
jgi:hypothetical protein